MIVRAGKVIMNNSEPFFIEVTDEEMKYLETT
jgi:hypothetical protein